MVTISDFVQLDKVAIDLGLPAITNKEDTLLTSLKAKCNQIIQNMLRPFADTLPYAKADITEDLSEAANLLVEAKWHRRKTHWEDYKNTMDEFKTTWDSIVTYLKSLPTERTKPISVSGNFASSSTLLKNMPFMTDSNGNLLPGF